MLKAKRTQLLLPPMLLLSLLLLLLPLAFYSVRAVPSKRTGVQLCGQNLNDALFLVCEGRFARIAKRDSLDLFDYAEQQNDNEDNEGEAATGVPSIWAKPFRSYNFMMTTKRPKRLVVDECCKNSCTWEEMKAYCLT